MEELPDSMNKINATDNPERINELYKMLTEAYADRYEIVRTDPRLIEDCAQGNHQGTDTEGADGTGGY